MDIQEYSIEIDYIHYVYRSSILYINDIFEKFLENIKVIYKLTFNEYMGREIKIPNSHILFSNIKDIADRKIVSIGNNIYLPYISMYMYRLEFIFTDKKEFAKFKLLH